jgi:hypothetical protein
VGWLVDLLLCRPPVPKPKTEKQLAYELVLRLMQSEKAEWPVTNSQYGYDKASRLCQKQTIFNKKANTTITYLMATHGRWVTEARVSVGGDTLELTFMQRATLEDAVIARVKQLQNGLEQQKVRGQLKLLVEAAEEIL